MKQFLLDLMSAMMPAMMPLVWIGGVAAIASILLVLARQARFARWAAGLTLAVAAFFLASQGMGAFLGTEPSINFGDPKQFEFILVPFWQIGLALLIPGAAVWVFSRQRSRTTTPPP